MPLLRSALLAVSASPWARTRATRLPFVRRAVRRFMPGERLEDALAAADVLRGDGIGVVLTRLGENVGTAAEAAEAARHYAEACARIAAQGLTGEVSVKLTQLGLDVDEGACAARLAVVIDAAARHGQMVWIDMEQYRYVDRTLAVYRLAREAGGRIGVCLQAYLHRTPADLEALLPLGGGIRLVKGAYREPAAVALARKADVDAQYVALAWRLLASDARAAGVRAVFGTHDRRVIEQIARHAGTRGLARGAYEFHLLYGIGRELQLQLARDGHRVRALISYGDQWFPWYMRRLAERPANLWFVVRSLVGR